MGPEADPRESIHVTEMSEMTEMTDFHPTFLGDRDEHWALEALQPLHDECWITDVLSRVKPGKDATIFCCRAHPAIGGGLLAAKAYRPRMLRTMKNDALYREGRELLDAEGKTILDRRRHAAISKKTAYGRDLLAGAWVHNEFAVMNALHAVGGDVPQPLACMGNTILMAFVGGEQHAAPTLHEARPSPDEAAQAAPRLLSTVGRLLAVGRVHADLSAYNVLWWDGVPWVIDFPQAVDAWQNPHAYELLQRDLARLGQFFWRYGVAWDAQALTDELWARYIRIPAEEMQA